jgi:hypothetical protein
MARPSTATTALTRGGYAFAAWSTPLTAAGAPAGITSGCDPIGQISRVRPDKWGSKLLTEKWWAGIALIDNKHPCSNAKGRFPGGYNRIMAALHRSGQVRGRRTPHHK